MAERCLVVGPAWVGDMIIAQSLYQALKTRYPALILDVLAPAWSMGILARMPEVRRSILSPFAHGQFDWAGRRRLARELRGQHYDWAIILPNSWKSALAPFLAGIPRRTGYVGEFRYGLLNDPRRLDKRALPRLVDRYCALADQTTGTKAGRVVSCPPRLTVNPGNQRNTLARFGLTTDRKILALCPGAEYGSAKRWPERHYAEVARAKRAAGWQIWLVGSARDQTVAAAIQQQTGEACVNLAGRTTLEETVDLLACSSAVVSNDSGLMHLAAAVGTPVLALYGSTDPGYTPPLADRARILRLKLECSPCFQRQCPLGHHHCLTQLHPEQVLTALSDLEASR